VGGSGYNLSGGDNGLSVQVYAQVAEFVIDEAGGCSETRIDTDGRCVECSKDCQFYTTSLPVGQTSGVVNFWAKASQTADGACECTSEIVAVSVTGQDPPDTIPVPLPVPEELGPIACETQVGDPINVTNGNLFLERLDVTFPSDLGFPMDFIRYYNSYDTVFTSLFRNWRHSFEYSLDSVDTQTYVLTEATGRRVKFTRTTLNNGATQIATYAPSYGVHYRLSIAGSPALYTVTREDDSKLCFQGLGKLDYMDDRMGTRTTLFYTDQLLDSVKNPSGRLLKFEYGLFGRLTGIRSGNDSLLVVYNYAPGAGGVPGAGALEKVRYQNPVETFEQYGYGTGSANQFHITQITSSDSPTRTYQYDAVGRAVQYSKASGAERRASDSRMECQPINMP
jgi:YD repeat-containing protein